MSNIIQFPKNKAKQKWQRSTKNTTLPSRHLPKPAKKKNSKANLALGISSVTLMVLSIPFANHFWEQSKNNRSIASTQNSNHKQDKQILQLLKNRRLASIGKAPTEKEYFTITELQSRYELEWQKQDKNKLKTGVIMEDYEPIKLPEIPILVKKYPNLFPKHHSLAPAPIFSSELESYELISENGDTIGLIETIRDKQGRVLSIYIQ